MFKPLILKSGGWLFALLFLVACSSGIVQAPPEADVTSTGTTKTSLQLKIRSAYDDAEEAASGTLRTGSSTALLNFAADGLVRQTVGLRFQHIPLPKGATVTSAYITFRAARYDSGQVSLVVQAEASDDAATFSASVRSISSRARTAAKATWLPRPWRQGLATRTSDLSAVVQEVVDRPGWGSGNALAFFVSGWSSVSRSAYAFEGNPAYAPALYITYELSDALPAEPPLSTLYGVIRSDPSRVATDRQAGIQSRTLDLSWDAYERADGAWDEAYMAVKRSEYRDAEAAGFKVVIDLGLQYPPAWLAAQPESRFVDQHGTAFVSSQPGASQVNAVFSARVRSYQARYVRKVFAVLGADPFAVRLGWGWYGEIGYPPVSSHTNSYWAYDPFAQGLKSGLPAGVTPSPVPGWRPAAGGAVTVEAQRSADLFLNWYLDSLENYQRWQIALLREVHDGQLFVLYPSFGVRPGQLEQAVRGGLTGNTPPEVNGEIQRGFDFARLVADINDPLVSPYTTWLDADGWFVNDRGSNPAWWSPARYLIELVRHHPQRLTVWGENTGNNRTSDLYLCFARVRDLGLKGMFWAFNSDLYNGGEVSIDDYATLIEDSQRVQAAAGGAGRY